MKRYEVCVYIAIDAEDAEAARDKVSGAVEYMFEVSNEDGDLISFATDDADEVFPDDED